MNVASNTMTRFLFTSALVACLGWTQAAHAQAEVEVFAEMGEPFTLYINQVKQNDAPAPRVLATGLDEGFYQFRIDFSDPSLPDLTKNSVGVEPASRTTLMVRSGRSGEYVLRMHNIVPLGGGLLIAQPDVDDVNAGWGMNSGEPFPNQAMESQVVVEPVHTQQTVHTSSTLPAGESTHETVSMNVSMALPGVNMGFSTGVSTSVTTTSTSTSTTTTTANHGMQSAPAPAPAPRPAATTAPARPARAVAMAPADFATYLNAVESKGFEESKLSTARAPLSSAYLTADQIRQVMTRFGFEETRVQFATLAHPRCTDPGNYYQVYEAFQFESSIEELQEALGQ